MFREGVSLSRKQQAEKKTQLTTAASPGLLQRIRANGYEPETVPLIVHEVLQSPGKPLDAEARALFEPHFYHDFSHVRVHAHEKAIASARALNAVAYTVGSDVVFGSGQFSPKTAAGRKLLAHELTHVVQQAGGHPSYSLNKTHVGEINDPFETEADAVAAEISDVAAETYWRSCRRPDRGHIVPVLSEPSRLRCKVSNDVGLMKENLTTGLFKWSVTEGDVRKVLGLLKKLEPADLKDTISALEREGLVDTIFTNSAATDRQAEGPLFDAIRQLRGGKSLLMHIPEALVCDKPHKGSWEMARSFNSVGDMVTTIEKMALARPLSKLGILAHGDKAGVIRIGSDPVSLTTLEAYAGKFRSLSRFLTASADLFLFGCISGAGRDGSALLKRFSLLLPGRRIIGYNVITTIPEAEAKKPGEMCYWPDIRATDIKAAIFSGQIKSKVPADDKAPAAKIAKDGKIVKWPADESSEMDDEKAAKKGPRKITPPPKKEKAKR
jgi:hypothetical protein